MQYLLSCLRRRAARRHLTPGVQADAARALHCRPVRAVLAAALLLSPGLVLLGGAPGAFAASPSVVGAVVRDETPAPGPEATDPAAGAEAPAPGAETAAPSTVATDDLIRLQLVPGASEARYRMTVKTLGQPPKVATCSTRSVTGEFVLRPDGTVVSEQSRISVDQRTLQCEPPLRTNMAQQLLETQTYPTADFVLREAPGLTVPFPVGDLNLPLIGDQSVHGISQPAEYATAATFDGDQMRGQSSAQFLMTSFNLKPPHIGPLLSVDDAMSVEFDFQAVRATTTAGDSGPSL
ncbi:MAG: YceI family protein [Chloroflexi bacterium]|nr:YceI family protein [Chloroflexota bacterium]